MLKISYTSYKEKYHSLQHNLISCHPLSHFIDAIMVWLILKALQLIDCNFFFFVLCLLYHMLRIILGCPLCIASSVFPNVYFNANLIGNAWIWKSRMSTTYVSNVLVSTIIVMPQMCFHIFFMKVWWYTFHICCYQAVYDKWCVLHTITLIYQNFTDKNFNAHDYQRLF